MNEKASPNRLINEKSPYLLQHAYNPVDWFPWGKEAFEKAKQENKPVFVSIGYSTCHWCHVMERESFEDEEVASVINERFVSIKVDREERPDLDSIYMSVCQVMTGQGGWPLNVFLTPDQVPFYAGTYFPKHSRYGRPGIIDVITQLHDTYINEPHKIEMTGERIKDAIMPPKQETSSEKLTMTAINAAVQQFKRVFDEQYGGFGSAPKFPTPHNLMFLLRYFHMTKDQEALNMVLKTLEGLSRGGIYDHIGYGFSRYSTDELYLVPHFEKMLYDNAMLLMAYTEAYQVTGENSHQVISEQIIEYVLRDMRHPDGGFYSAEDADSEGVEGKFYIWDYFEIFDHLDEDVAELYCAVYDITPEGNFEGENIPNLIREPIDSFAAHNDLDAAEVRKQLEEARKVLFNVREERVHPHKDDKILTAWNGLMIAALAKAGRVYNHQEALVAAKSAIQFIEQNLIVDGRVMVRYRDGEVKQEGFIDDYAYLLWAYIELYETTFDLSYLKKAKTLTHQMIELFWDGENGGFYFYGEDNEELLIRPKDVYDGALPSGNSVATLQMLRLARLTGEFSLEDKVQNVFDAFGDDVIHYPMGHTYMLMAYMTTQMKMKEVVVLGSTDSENNVITHLHKEFHPNLTYLANEDSSLFTGVADFAAGYSKVNDQETYYVCENFVCYKPLTSENEAIELINGDKES
ncbi:thioredoxin domain-containing protein [Pradoshia sp. D12]|uniref:thioredoxin domain-containing protein n=1 Tax=Bacillaceae TaxID=186817 RepID=UPI00112A2F87|nr:MULTISPECIES: thioredoxin domain-containing protein [Bacillaceae]QFK71402.1 thioredoxin domain-containing protein [Pradoshia sp. D12]TPF73197.1 thioredoxin domain-containing protein [Bacillus sp. D12]